MTKLQKSEETARKSGEIVFICKDYSAVRIQLWWKDRVR